LPQGRAGRRRRLRGAGPGAALRARDVAAGLRPLPGAGRPALPGAAVAPPGDAAADGAPGRAEAEEPPPAGQGRPQPELNARNAGGTSVGAPRIALSPACAARGGAGHPGLAARLSGPDTWCKM